MKAAYLVPPLADRLVANSDNGLDARRVDWSGGW